MSPRIKTWLVVVGAVGLLFRLALSWAVAPVLASDSLEYHQYAENLVKEHRYYMVYAGRQHALRGSVYYSFRPPGYPFLVAAVYEVAGIRPQAVSFLQALMDLAAGIFIFLIACNWLKPRHALWALVAAQAHFLYVPMLLSETLFLFLFTGSLWIVCGTRARSWGWTVINGLAWGAMILTKPQTIVLAPVFLGYLLLRNFTRPALIKGAVWLGIMALTLVPWLLREKEVHGKWVWFSSRGGRTFFEGNYLPMDMGSIYAAAKERNLDEVGMDQLFYQVTVDYLKKHPGHYFREGVRRVALLWDLRTTNWLQQTLFLPVIGSGGAARSVLLFASLFIFNCYRLFVIAGVIGAVLEARKYRELIILYAIPAVLMIFHFALFIGASRYLVPIYPSLCIFFAVLIETLSTARTGAKVQPRPV